jgi:hypothetical protein
MRYRIIAPASPATCTVAGVAFVNGVGETDSEIALAYFRRHGYGVEEIQEPVAETVSPSSAKSEIDPCEPAPMPDRWDSTRDWREWASTVGGMTVDEAAQLDREQLATHFIPEAEAAEPAAPAEPTTSTGRQRRRTASRESTS